MVNYRGPEVLRDVMDAMQIPIFDRVSQVRFDYDKFDSIPATNQDLNKLKRLEKVVFSKKRRELTESDVEVAKQLVSPCRIASMDQKRTELAVDLNRVSGVGCMSSMATLDTSSKTN